MGAFVDVVVGVVVVASVVGDERFVDVVEFDEEGT